MELAGPTACGGHGPSGWSAQVLCLGRAVDALLVSQDHARPARPTSAQKCLQLDLQDLTPAAPTAQPEGQSRGHVRWHTGHTDTRAYVHTHARAQMKRRALGRRKTTPEGSSGIKRGRKREKAECEPWSPQRAQHSEGGRSPGRRQGSECRLHRVGHEEVPRGRREGWAFRAGLLREDRLRANRPEVKASKRGGRNGEPGRNQDTHNVAGLHPREETGGEGAKGCTEKARLARRVAGGDAQTHGGEEQRGGDTRHAPPQDKAGDGGGAGSLCRGGCRRERRSGQGPSAQSSSPQEGGGKPAASEAGIFQPGQNIQDPPFAADGHAKTPARLEENTGLIVT